MNRIFFLSALVLIFELVSWLSAKGALWILQPYLTINHRCFVIIFLIISNLFLVALIFGAFRITLGFLAILWLFLLALLLAAAVSLILNNAGVTGEHLPRVIFAMIFIGLLSLGVFNAYSPVVRHATVAVDKPLASSVRLAVVSDLHLGKLFGNKQLDNLADILNNHNVDVLLIAGDVMDDNTQAFRSQQMHTHFAKVVAAAKQGTFVSLGNHDLYQVDARADIVQAIKATGAVLLDDKVATLAMTKANQTLHLNIVGRFDDHYEARLPTADLLDKINNNYPTILLDHRPSQIDDNSQLPIDLQVSGHTHNGQVFPANFIVQAINRVGYGFEKVNDMAVVVSSGYGFWGVPLRLGSRSEVWIVDLVAKDH